MRSDDAPSALSLVSHGSCVGRARELAEARLAWKRASEGECQVLLVSGEPGIGKTRFVSELLLDVQREGARAWVGECYAQGRAPYAPLAQVIGDVISRRESEADLAQRVLGDLVTSMPSLRARFPDYAAVEEPDPQSAQLRLFESFFAFCAAACAKGPLVLVVDDAHWADADTLLLLRNMARRSRRLPVFLVMTYREGDLDGSRALKDWLLELSRDRMAIHLRLSPLGREDTRELLAGMFDQDVTAEFLDGIYHQTEGNPFFIEEICMALVERGQFTFKEGRWEYPSLSRIVIPQTVRAVIDARLEQLPEPSRDALRMAAILGRDFEFETLRRAAHLEEDDLIEALEAALRVQLIRELPPGHRRETRYGFAHALIPTALRDSLMAVRRRRMHFQAALAVEEVHPDALETISYHAAESGDEPRARRYNRLAGDRALQTAPADAARFYRAALFAWPEDHDPPGRAETLSRLGYSLWVLGNVPEAQECFEGAHAVFARLGMRAQSSEMKRMIGRVYWERADRGLALRHYHEALADLEDGPETLEMARALSSLSQIYMLAPDPEQAIAWGQRALALAERLQSDEVAAHALNNIGSSYAQEGQFEKGIVILRDSLQRARADGLPRDTCRSYYNLGVMLHRWCDYAGATDVISELHAYATKVFAHHIANLALWRLQWIEWERGRWSEALARQGELGEFRNSLYTTWAARTSAMMDLDIGRTAEALKALEDTLPSALRAMDAQTTVAHLGQLVRAYGASGQEARAAQTVRTLLQTVSQTRGLAEETITAMLAACQQAARLDSPELAESATECFAVLERIAPVYRTGEAIAAVAEARGCLAVRANAPGAAACFREAAHAWEKTGRPYDRARALSLLATAASADGQDAESRAAEEQARAICSDLAAQLDPVRGDAFRQTVAAWLNRGATRAPERKPAGVPGGKDPNALTPREEEVLRHLAMGLTNAQIADKLVVSPLTVNAHVRSIFMKLDVNTRTAAARLAIERGLA